jgi:uncharacterized protein YabE (DUF348 family)
MKKAYWSILILLLALSSCQSSGRTYHILINGQITSVITTENTPAQILSVAGITLNSGDILYQSGIKIPINAELNKSDGNVILVRRAVDISLITPDGEKKIKTSAMTVGQALEDAGITIYKSDYIQPPPESPIADAITINYIPSRELAIKVGGKKLRIRSAGITVAQAFADAGIPLIGLDNSTPPFQDLIPKNGQIDVVRRVETIALNQTAIPFETRTEPSADLELDQQALLQGGEPGLAVTRVRTVTEDGVKVSQSTDSESIIRPPQDRILGYGTKIVIRTAVVDGITIQYYRSLTLATTSYSPCRSLTPDGSCSYGTSSGLPVERGTVAMVYSWYLAFGFDRLYIPGYGYATVGDVGAGPSGSHYWVDLGFSDADYQPISGSSIVYFLTPVPANLVYVLP